MLELDSVDDNVNENNNDDDDDATVYMPDTQRYSKVSYIVAVLLSTTGMIMVLISLAYSSTCCVST